MTPLSAFLLLFLLVPQAQAQSVVAPTGAKAVDDAAFRQDAPGTSATADLSYVLSAGNSSANSLGLRGDLKHRWGRHSVQLQGGALRASSSSGQRSAHGTPDRFEIRTPPAEPTAEVYDARGRYDYKIGQRLFHTASAGWERNRFAGIANRWVMDTGIGNVFAASEQTNLRAALTITYTEQGKTVFGRHESSFVGSRLGWDVSRKLTQTSTLLHTLIADQSLEEWRARRADAQFGLRVAMTRAVALKVNWRVLYNNTPPQSPVPLFARDGEPTGLTVLVPYERLDQAFSVSLVLSRSAG